MVYSEQVNGVFCIARGIFVAKVSKGKCVCKPFRNWNKKGEKAKEHEQCLYHHQAIEQADNFKRTLENPDTTITAQSDTRRAANVARNRAVLKSIASAVLYCARQCIALRGDAESVESPGNPCNSLSLLRLLAVHDEELRKYLEIPAMRCATYLSPQTQNELIIVMGNHILLQGIIGDLTAAPFYAILADEVTSHNVEHLAICARWYLGFLEENNIPLATMRGQGYDGASKMSSDRVGVQARIRDKAPLAIYVHCSGHCLNLVISKSCALPEIRNVINCVKRRSRFFLNSPKRSGVLEMIINHDVVNEERRKPLIDLCKTRWAERH
ncbi:zinc finger MYM-type protein 1-like [Corticium candelabrum]|uniref:zinc finger MYM-type protein 1-like n=1 Tax=Corticium candelabrum TaxID=121492 RepID=UPI002E276862|nr:zinc finger MYM-type protein 1-like [Corticium candelabrum]